MPTFGDTPNLLYIEAIAKEVSHWQHPSLGGLHHVLRRTIYTEDSGFLKGQLWWRTTSFRIPMKPFSSAHTALTPIDGSENPPVRRIWIWSTRLLPVLMLVRIPCPVAITRHLWAYNFDHAYENGQKLEIDP